MIIYLGRRLPGASSDLPGSRDGSGRSVSGSIPDAAANRDASTDGRSAPLFGLAPDGVYRARPVARPAGELLPHRFTLTPTAMPRHPDRGGLFSVALSLPGPARDRAVGVTHHRALWSPDFPPRTSSTRAPGSVRFPSRSCGSGRGATAIIAPATNSDTILRPGVQPNNPAFVRSIHRRKGTLRHRGTADLEVHRSRRSDMSHGTTPPPGSSNHEKTRRTRKKTKGRGRGPESLRLLSCPPCFFVVAPIPRCDRLGIGR